MSMILRKSACVIIDIDTSAAMFAQGARRSYRSLTIPVMLTKMTKG